MLVSVDAFPLPFLVFDSKFSLIGSNDAARLTLQHTSLRLGTPYHEVFIATHHDYYIDEQFLARDVLTVLAIKRYNGQTYKVQKKAYQEGGFTVTLLYNLPEGNTSLVTDTTSNDVNDQSNSPSRSQGNPSPDADSKRIGSLDDILTNLESTRNPSSALMKTILDKVDQVVFCATPTGKHSLAACPTADLRLSQASSLSS